MALWVDGEVGVEPAVDGEDGEREDRECRVVWLAATIVGKRHETTVLCSLSGSTSPLGVEDGAQFGTKSEITPCGGSTRGKPVFSEAVRYNV